MDLSGFTPFTVFNPGETSFVLLTLPEGILTPGFKYRFKLTVYNGSEEGAASMDVEVRVVPTSGLFAVQPTSVKALDIVTMSGKREKNDEQVMTPVMLDRNETLENNLDIPLCNREGHVKAIYGSALRCN